LRDEHIDYALCAPTGRAAKRLTEATGDGAKTIHRLLKYDHMLDGFTFDKYNRLPHHCIIIDESSMVDLFLMKSLMEAVSDNARIIIIGDVDQLPSVGPGTILRDLINSKRIPVVRLTKVFRQKGSSTIISVAHDINNGIVPMLPPPAGAKGHNCIFVTANSHEEVLGSMMALVTKHLPAAGIKPDDIQILSPMKVGPLGVEIVNPLLQSALNPPSPDKTELKMKDCSIFRLDDRIMHIRNDYKKDVFNGDVGRIAAINKDSDGSTTIFVQYPDKPNVVEYEPDTYSDLKLAYSASVHKSQGGEFPVVLMLLHDAHYRMLQRNLVYTAVTRAKKLFIFIGTESALSRAVYNKTESKRNTTLKELLIAK
jgi:exodeoxyribonuclease V alpha subunit